MKNFSEQPRSAERQMYRRQKKKIRERDTYILHDIRRCRMRFNVRIYDSAIVNGII